MDVHRLRSHGHRRRGPLQLHDRDPGVTEPGCAPFFAVTVFGRGLLNRLFTRCYVPGTWLDGDGFLASVPAERRHTLIAKPAAHGLRFDIRLQGHDETVFLRHA